MNGSAERVTFRVAVATLVAGALVAAFLVVLDGLMSAIDRGKQKRMYADMRSIGTALELYAQDHGAYPSSARADDLSTYLVPRYIKVLPVTDNWGNAFVYQVDPTGSRYTVLSFGSDGAPDGFTGGATTRSDADIYFVDGRFVQWARSAEGQAR